VSWEGTSVGSDRSRRLDQARRLSFVRLGNSELTGLVDGVSLTVSYAQTEEDQRRVRASGASDRQGFEVDTLGLLAQFHSDTPFGSLTYGVDYYADAVDSFSTSNPVQGPVADDADYATIDFYLQDRIEWHARSELTFGLRRTSADVRARSVLDPATGEPFQIDESWSATVANVGASWAFVPDRVALFANVSQGFRAPNLSDLSRFDSARSNEIEVPVRGLEEERFLSREIGFKVRTPQSRVQLAYFDTDIEGQIQRVPTGRLIDGEYEVTKANVGDGEVRGIELSWRTQLHPRLDAYGHAAWLDGEVDTYPTSQPVPVSEPLDRLMPVNGALGVRWRPGGPGIWVESEVVSFADQDDLSTADARDTTRIPPGGTPGFTVLNLRFGMRITENLDLTVAMDNATDVDYRIHGSGTNMPGRNLIVTLGARL
jgi:hemoglobin/transferrin/lactoferrin receptor protein